MFTAHFKLLNGQTRKEVMDEDPLIALVITKIHRKLCFKDS